MTSKAASQQNNGSSTDIHPLAVLNEGVFHKNEIENLQRAEIAKEITRISRLTGNYGGSCVQFVRRFEPNLPQIGAAKNLETNTGSPQEGAIIKTKESYLGHLAYVIWIQDDKILIAESNYGWDNRIGMRWLNIDDDKIIGYWIGGDI